MALVISSMKTCVSCSFKWNIPSLLVPAFQEYQYRSVLFHAEGQQIWADGLLSGIPSLDSTRQSFNHRLLGRYWNVYHSGNCDSYHGQDFEDAEYDSGNHLDADVMGKSYRHIISSPCLVIKCALEPRWIRVLDAELLVPSFFAGCIIWTNNILEEAEDKIYIFGFSRGGW